MFYSSGAKFSFLFHREFGLIYIIKSFIKLIILVRTLPPPPPRPIPQLLEAFLRVEGHTLPHKLHV